MFLTLEGGEGSGKSTQARLLAARLRAAGREVVLTEEPRGTEFGLRCWELLARGLDATSELLIFAAARAHHVRTLIAPALERGSVVVCDRYSDSTLAYQQYGRGLDAELVKRVCQSAEGGVVADLTLFLDLPPEVGLRRKGEAAEDDAISAETLEFHLRVRAGFQDLAARERKRIRLIDANQKESAIAVEVWKATQAALLRSSADD